LGTDPTFDYDSTGQRVQRVDGDGTRKFVYDGAKGFPKN